MSDPEKNRKTIHDVHAWIESDNAAAITDCFATLPTDELILVTSRLDSDDQLRLLEMLPAEISADVLHLLPFSSASELVEDLSVESAADIIDEMPTSRQADLVGEMDPDQAEAILALLDKTDADRVKQLVAYDDDVVGGLMDNRYVSLDAGTTVAGAVEQLRIHADRYSDYEVQYAYVTEGTGTLVGVLRLRDLLLASAQTRLEQIMIKNPRSVGDQMPLDDLREFFLEHHYLGVPVVNESGQMLGVVNRTALEQALGERYSDDWRKTQGLIREELRTMPLLERSRWRLMWLSVNIVLNLLAASVIAMYQETLQQVIALAVFLPIISDMSGCSGNQAVAVSMRELSLGLVEPREVWRVWFKEISVGMINGLVLGTLLALLAWFWQGNPWLGLVVGLALMLNTMVAVSIGGTLPLVMRILRFDPALASGPILTTVTDLCGFFLVLGTATRFLHLLV